jgi:hypothetical protein
MSAGAGAGTNVSDADVELALVDKKNNKDSTDANIETDSPSDNTVTNSTTDPNDGFHPGYVTWYFHSILFLIMTICYCTALLGKSYSIKLDKCAYTSTSWPKVTKEYYQNTNKLTDITSNKWWYFGEWEISNLGENVLCPIYAYDNEYNECNKESRNSCSNTPKYCIKKDSTESNNLFIDLKLKSTWEDLISYRSSWEHYAIITIILFLISIIFSYTAHDHFPNADIDNIGKADEDQVYNDNDEHAWHKSFIPVKNHFAFDHNTNWKAHKTIYTTFKLQFVCNIIILSFIITSYNDYSSNIGAILADPTIYYEIFPSCTINFIESASGLYIFALLCCLIALVIEIIILLHCYIKIHNGGIFRFFWNTIEEST